MVEAELRDIELVVEQVDDHVQRAEARAEMPRSGLLDGDEGVQTTDVREQGETQVGFAVRAADTVDVVLRDERERHAERR